MPERDEALDALRQAIGGEPPASLRRLDGESLAQLAELLESSRTRQQEQLQQALEKALGYLPRLMRGPVRRILFPGKGR